MKEWRTIGREIYKGMEINIFYSDELVFSEEKDKGLYQILFIDEGSVICGLKGQEKSLLPPVVLCLNYSETVQPVTLTNAKGFSIMFRAESINHGLNESDENSENKNPDFLETEHLLLFPFLTSTSENPVTFPVNGRTRERILRVANNMKTQFFDQPDNYWPCRGRSFFLEILMLLQAMQKIEKTDSVQLSGNNGEISDIAKEIHLNYCDSNFEIEDLPVLKGFGGMKIKKVFKKEYNYSPKNYLEYFRNQVACNLLKNTILPIEDVARRCGYSSPEKFTKIFAKKQNCKPEAWRAKFPNPYGC